MKSPWRGVLGFFYIMTSCSGHQEHRGRVWLSLIWASVEISGHKGSLFWIRHLPMKPETEMLRLKYQRITNQTKRAWLLNLLLIEQPFPLATSHEESFGKMHVEIHFLSTNMEHSPAEIMLFFGHLTKETWSMSKRQRDMEKSRNSPR